MGKSFTEASNKRKSLMEASGAMDLMATALDLLARALKNKGKQHKWLGHSISGWVTAYVVGLQHKWLGHSISGWVTV